MWKALFLSLLVVAMNTLVHADYAARCRGAKTACTRSALKRQRGKCTVQIDTSCNTITSAKQGCISSSSLYESGKTCRNVKKTQDVECWARAVASAFAEASVTAECKGKGKACAEVNIDATATACAVAEAIVDIAIFTGKDKEPACQAAVLSVIDATVTASSSAMIEACAVANKPVMIKSFELNEAVKEVISSAFGSCWVYCDDVVKGPEQSVEVIGEATATVVIASSATASGTVQND